MDANAKNVFFQIEAQASSSFAKKGRIYYQGARVNEFGSAKTPPPDFG